MKRILYGAIAVILICPALPVTLRAQEESTVSNANEEGAALIYQDDFENDLSQWVVEQMPGGTTEIKNGKLEINDAKGCAVWFKKKLESPVMIEYEATMVKESGPYDRVSDLNCFWMAIDPQRPDDLFAYSKVREGNFRNYHPLRLYYVGYGANDNTTTRFRRYPGDGSRPCLPEHDLKNQERMNKPNETMTIRLIADGKRIQYIRNGDIVFHVVDEEPYREGWFGFRTVRNHMILDNFKVYRLHAEQE